MKICAAVLLDFELINESAKIVIDSRNKTIKREYLLIKSTLPEELVERYGDIPNKIYVRECYRDLYELSAATMLGDRRTISLFTGVPGIGKSIFMIYFIYRYLSDARFHDKRFALEFNRGTYIMLSPIGSPGASTFTVAKVNADRIKQKNFLLLCDIDEPAQPIARAKWTFIFSSPDPKRYKEIMKTRRHFGYTVPTWSITELRCLDPDYDSWRANYAIFGGVPRHVFPEPGENDPIIAFEKAIATKGKEIASSVFAWGYGATGEKINYMLVHINPPESPEGVVNYKGRTVYSFASFLAFQRLYELDQNKFIAKAISLFNRGVAALKFGASTAGVYFERMCLWLCPITGQRLQAIRLQDRKLPLVKRANSASTSSALGSETAEFQVPTDRLPLPTDWKKAGNLQPNKFYVPNIDNLESADAFYLTPIISPQGTAASQARYRLVVLQITVASSHPVKANGIVNILKAFPAAIRARVTEKALVFINDYKAKIGVWQNFVSKYKKKLTKVPAVVKNFKQYVCAYTFSTVLPVEGPSPPMSSKPSGVLSS